MKIIIGGRQSGRTTKLIEMAAEAEERGEVSYIVCATQQAAYSINKRAEEMGLNIRFPISYDEFLEGEYQGKIIKNFYIDNADMLLQYVSRMVTVAGISVETEIEGLV